MTAVIASLPAQTQSGLQFAETGKRHLPADQDKSLAVAVGDVDGDGDLDMVVGNKGQQDRLYLNDGTGTFSDATANRMPFDNDNTTSVALGDVDGDGDLDLVFGSFGYLGTTQNRLYLNNGTGVFSDATASQMPVDFDSTVAVALGDVDGDGDLDIVIGNFGYLGTPQNRLYLNNGTGVFSDATTSRLPVDIDSTDALALGDVDGDGDLDIVIGNLGQQNRLYINDGTGTFSDDTASRMPMANDATRSLAFGDVDGDGDLDMLIGNGQQRLYVNDGTGTYSDATATRMPVANDATQSVTLGDVDGDGDLDMVFGNFGQNRLHINDGTGQFSESTTSRMPAETSQTSAVVLGDVDGDGDLDLVLGQYGFPGGQPNRLYTNDGTGTFSDATATRMPPDCDPTNAVALGDIDGDGDLDMVLGNSPYVGRPQNRLLLNDGTGTFSDATAGRMPLVNDGTRSVALGDVDGDGDLDMLIGN
ncbi:MAG: VCBS repeat-containing protein, partial [Planctomycetes bacterium]|nr:VCBS repeat-containing protein [Planctomycetota bacterium]